MKRPSPSAGGPDPSQPPGVEAPTAAPLTPDGADEDGALIAHARADIAAGQFTDNQAVEAWLKRWGSPDVGRAPRTWAKTG